MKNSISLNKKQVYFCFVIRTFRNHAPGAGLGSILNDGDAAASVLLLY